MLERAADRLGFGTYTLTGTDGTELVTAAIEAGYRHVDTARLYENEREVGDAIEAASVDRDDLFVATKVAHFEEPEPTPGYVRTAIEQSRERLGVESLDLLYHHWPRSVDRSHGAIWNWTHTLSEAQADPPIAEPSRVTVDKKQIEVDGEKKWLYAAIDTDSKLLLEIDVFSRRGIGPAAFTRAKPSLANQNF